MGNTQAFQFDAFQEDAFQTYDIEIETQDGPVRIVRAYVTERPARALCRTERSEDFAFLSRLSVTTALRRNEIVVLRRPKRQRLS